MSTRKFQRELFKRMKEMLPGSEARLLRSVSHYVYEITYQGHSIHYAVANSPRDVDHAVDNSLKQIRRLFAQKGAA